MGPATTGPSANAVASIGRISRSASVSSVEPATTTTSREPCTPSSTGLPTRAALLRTSNTTDGGSSEGGLPTSTVAEPAGSQPRAAARESTDSSASPRTTPSTTRASRRASQAPRASAAAA